MRFTTFERAIPDPLDVVKRDGARQEFDRTKLRAALLRSTHKRQVGAAEIEELVERIEQEVAAAGGALGAERIGELCVEGLRELDYGAYLQFLGTLPTPNADFAASSKSGSVRGGGQSASLPPRSFRNQEKRR